VSAVVAIVCEFFLKCLIYLSYAPGLHVSPAKWVTIYNEGFADPDSQYQGLVELNIELLLLERELVNRRLIFLNGPRSAKKTTLIKNLISLWLVTGFVDHVLYIDAKHFLESWVDQRVRAVRGQPSTSTVFRLHRRPCGEEEESQIWIPRMMVVIDHVDLIFGDESTEPRRKHAQRRFDGFMSKLREVYSSDSHPILLPYIIVIGQQPGQWWERKFRWKSYGGGFPIFLSQPATVRPMAG
jgi:hypothetical protein